MFTYVHLPEYEQGISTLDMIHLLSRRADVVTIEHNLAFEFVPILLDVVVLDHDDHHVNLLKELVEVEDLVFHNLLVGEERVEALQRTSEVAFLDVEHLEGRTFADVVHILLVGNAIQAHATVVSNPVLFHNLMDALQNEGRLGVIGLHTLVNHLGQLWIVAHEEPWVDADAMAAYARAGLQDIHAGVHIANLYYFIYIHVVVAADASQLIGKGDIDGTKGILYDLGHFGRADVSDHNLTLAEGGIILLYFLTDLLIVGTNGAVVMQELIDHVSRDDALGGMDEVDVFADGEAVLHDDGTDELVDGAGAYRALNHYGSALGADLHHVLHGSDHIAGVHLLGELVVRRRDGDDVCVRLLILGGELDAGFEGGFEELVEALLLEGRLACVEGCHEVFVVVSTNDFHAMGSHH